MTSEAQTESDYDKIIERGYNQINPDGSNWYREPIDGYNTAELKTFAKSCMAELDRIRNEEREKEREALRAQIEADIKNLEKREPGAPYFIAQISGLTWVLSLPYFASQKKKAEIV